MAQRTIEFDAQSLLHLLVHYTMDHEGSIPLDGELTSAGVSAILPRMIALEVKSDKWEGIHIPPGWTEPYPLHVRYEGKKVMCWGNDLQKNAHDTWKDSVDSPLT